MYDGLYIYYIKRTKSASIDSITILKEALLYGCLQLFKILNLLDASENTFSSTIDFKSMSMRK